jgi:hypothetical protein
MGISEDTLVQTEIRGRENYNGQNHFTTHNIHATSVNYQE